MVGHSTTSNSGFCADDWMTVVGAGGAGRGGDHHLLGQVVVGRHRLREEQAVVL
jgi:hypothetical protein